jgi:hypothetical protein
MNTLTKAQRIDNLTAMLPALIIAARGWDPYTVDHRDGAMRKIAWIDRQILDLTR